MSKRVYCGDCEKSWSRKAGFDEHFKLAQIKSGDSGGALTKNPCHERKRKVWGYTLEEARASKKQKTVSAFASIPQVANKDIPDSHDQHNQFNNEDDSNVQNPDATDADMPKCSESTQAQRNDVLVNNQLLHDILKIVKQIDGKVDKQFKDNKQGQDTELKETVAKLIAPSQEYDQHVNQIRSTGCNSMSQILKNRLIDGIFEIAWRDDKESLVCVACQKHAKNYRKGFDLEEGSNYSVWSSGIKLPMTKWFSNFKRKLMEHLQSNAHHKAVKDELKQSAVIFTTKEKIFKSMRHLAYFTLKSNLPFDQFPSLLATANCCGVELGDINHTRNFVVAFLDLVNAELVDKTVKWFEEQDEVTCTLDIGTVHGVTLLATLFMSKGKVKLANIAPTPSKKGKDVAETCYDAMKLYGKVS